MARPLSSGLRILALCIYVGSAFAEDSEPPNIGATSQVGEPQSIGDLLDIYSDPRGPAQQLPHPGIDTLFDSNSLGTALAQPAFASKSPIIPQHITVTGYVDADSLGNRNVYADSTFAPFSGIYESGLRLRATGDASWYQFITSENPRTYGTGRYLEGDFLMGYGLWAPRFNVTGLVGPAFAQIDSLGTITDRRGVKTSIEVSARPTDWTIAAGSISYSTVTNDLQAQARAGLKMFDGVYVGPEAKLQSVSAEANIAYMHLGAFSALNVGRVAVGISGGWAHDRQLGSGSYGSASLYVPF
jgi:hypothetical protein